MVEVHKLYAYSMCSLQMQMPAERGGRKVRHQCAVRNTAFVAIPATDMSFCSHAHTIWYERLHALCVPPYVNTAFNHRMCRM